MFATKISKPIKLVIPTFITLQSSILSPSFFQKQPRFLLFQLVTINGCHICEHDTEKHELLLRRGFSVIQTSFFFLGEKKKSLDICIPPDKG